MRNVLIICKISTEKNFRKNFHEFFFFSNFFQFCFTNFFQIIFWLQIFFFLVSKKHWGVGGVVCVRSVLVCEWGVVSVVEIIFFLFFRNVGASVASGGGCRRAKRAARRRPRCRSRRLRQQRVDIENFL